MHCSQARVRGRICDLECIGGASRTQDTECRSRYPTVSPSSGATEPTDHGTALHFLAWRYLDVSPTFPRSTSGGPGRACRARAELNVTQKEDELLVTGKGHPDRHEGVEFLYRGIGARDFERRFQLADHVRVTSARLQNGLLSIDLQRELPEEKKPRPIRIDAEATPRTITQQ
jgi:hypothetical protein